ncbi:MFS general substrate transporter, partial [Aureobasidium melanogenum]
MPTPQSSDLEAKAQVIPKNAGLVDLLPAAGPDDIPLDVPGYAPDIHYTPSEVRKAKLKVDLLIMPFIVLCFCFLQFDRTNIGNALTDSFRKDLKLKNSDINLAQTLFTVGFIITELPFNMISKYIGPERFLPITMVCWGTATWSQVFLKSPSGLCAARFFIGALEGGYIPGFVLYISRYYSNGELGLRLAIFWASNSIAGMLGGPLSIGLLSLRGSHGLKGWQWLFLIEGVLTCILGVAAYFYLPHSAVKPKSFFGRSLKLFTEREGKILVTRVIRDDPTKGFHHGKPLLPSHLLATFSDWRLYGHLIAGLLSMVMISPMNTYAPSIIKSLGFTGLQANGLNSVGSAGALVWVRSLELTVQRLENQMTNAPLDGASDPSESAQTSARSHAAAPLQVIHDALHDPSGVEQDPGAQASIVQKNLVSAAEANCLLGIFQQHYGRWLSVAETNTPSTGLGTVRDPLLLCAICLVASRHSLIQIDAIALFAEVRSLLGDNLQQPQRPLAFFQASLVLSLWSSAFGPPLTSPDAWLVTGMALQQGMVSDVIKDVAMGNIRDMKDAARLNLLYLWNHLCLSHLHACITMRRKAMISAAHIKQAQLITRVAQSSNFEIRMAAELCLYWTIHQELEMETPDLSRSRDVLRLWKNDWEFLFAQERHHFIQMGLTFAHLLVLERSHGDQSSSMSDPSTVDMLSCCSEILETAIQTTDERTELLTDHVYHMITFAALTLSRLLHKHEQGSSTSFDTTTHHALITKTWQWLGSIGLSGHIGRTMSTIIATLYQSLFPSQANPTDGYRLNQDTESFIGMPEFFDLDAFDWDSLH